MNNKLVCLCIACAAGFLLASCIKSPPGFDPRDAGNVYAGCRIKQTFDQEQYSSFTKIFLYNSSNDPISVTTVGGPSTGNPDLYFKYDGKKRLVEMAGLYNNGGYEYLHRYKYEQNRIAVDTTYNFGEYGVPPPPGAFAAYHYFLYDGFDRIVRDSFVYVNTSIPGDAINYSYDAAGNLAGPSKMYDNKLNPHRTNKVWMFIDRNYSVNNPVVASAYNSSGLPLHFDLNGYFLNSYYAGVTDIMYDCK